ncbi:conserved phage C-terminal domain-containing protein [Bacillus sp. ISL-47]|uniref:conserved phage C-terminal domain-containing protein n=1 Tax=Bacillus sp. ISL-47 TaxID=2819130 RepID=UPI001BE6E396|nr:conserved phage C-terminal domain-containing protein [Bacillus sp. ISL-47]MBT2690985.1 conserved phage C-terminal domain-containing protein [Bacillus sp. ISL-47]MBT2710404.1 conserved phage C-terminal domain-containing protein [Pseudomonas sp. ISL-84]
MLARKIRGSPLWKSLKATHRLVLIELLLQAQFQDNEVVRNGEILFLKRGQVATSYQQLVNDIGDKDVTVKVVRNAVGKLVKHNFLTKDEAKSRAKKGLLLTIVNYEVYQDPQNYVAKEVIKETGSVRAKQGQSKGKAGAINNKEKKVINENIPYSEIIHFLNEAGNKNFRSTGKHTRSLIKERWNEGFRLEDFKHVTKVKAEEWLGGQYESYLRPATLFGNKFEGYLNQQLIHKSKRPGNLEALREEAMKADEESGSD